MADLSLKSILSNIPYYTNDAIMITDAQPLDERGPAILFVNPKFTQITGYDVSEVLGKNPRLLQGPDTSRDATQSIRKAIKTWHPVAVELLNYKKDGTPFWNDISIVPVADDKGIYKYWISIQRDTTDLHRHRDDLTLRSLAIDASSDAIAICEMYRDGLKVVYGNKPFTALLEGSNEPQGPALLNMLDAPLQQEVMSALNEAVAFGRVHVSEGLITSPGGRSLYARISIEPIPAEYNRAKTLLLSIRDKTEEQAQKKEIAETQRLRALGQLTGGVAHDFNNLLTIVTHC